MTSLLRKFWKFFCYYFISLMLLINLRFYFIISSSLSSFPALEAFPTCPAATFTLNSIKNEWSKNSRHAGYHPGFLSVCWSHDDQHTNWIIHPTAKSSIPRELWGPLAPLCNCLGPNLPRPSPRVWSFRKKRAPLMVSSFFEKVQQEPNRCSYSRNYHKNFQKMGMAHHWCNCWLWKWSGE